MDDQHWAMEEPAKVAANALGSEAASSLPVEILALDQHTAVIICDLGGVDYAFTMQRVPNQRPRPLTN